MLLFCLELFIRAGVRLSFLMVNKGSHFLSPQKSITALYSYPLPVKSRAVGLGV